MKVCNHTLRRLFDQGNLHIRTGKTQGQQIFLPGCIGIGGFQAEEIDSGALQNRYKQVICNAELPQSLTFAPEPAGPLDIIAQPTLNHGFSTGVQNTAPGRIALELRPLIGFLQYGDGRRLQGEPEEAVGRHSQGVRGLCNRRKLVFTKEFRYRVPGIIRHADAHGLAVT